MRNLIAIVFCLASSVLAAFAVKAAPQKFNLRQEVDKRVKTLNKELRYKKAERVEAFEKLRAEEMFATSAYCRAFIDLAAVNTCRCNGMWELDGWDVRLGSRIPAIAQRDLDDAEVPFGERAKLAAKLAEYYAGENDYVLAEKVMRTTLADRTKHTGEEDARAHLALADVYRWQDRFDEAWREIETAATFEAKDYVMAAGLALAKVDGSTDRVMKLLSCLPSEYARLDCLLYNKWTDAAMRKRAMDFVLCATNHPGDRAQAAMKWFGASGTPECLKAFAAVKGLKVPEKPKYSIWNIFSNPVNWAMARGDWDHILRINETFLPMALADHFSPRSPLYAANMQYAYALALTAKGQKDRALEVIASNVVLKAVKPLEKAKFGLLEAFAKDGDVAAAAMSGEFEQKDRIELVRTAAHLALVLGKDELAEKLSAKFRSFYVDQPQRTLKVAFSKEPVRSVTDWRKLYASLDRQNCDRKFGVNLEALATDVASRRELVQTTEKDSQDTHVEVSSVCDLKGLHIFLRVADPNARAVEAGFAGGMGLELYFAPGKYEPYICFGADPRTGVSGRGFHTKYDSATYRRVLLAKDPENFRQEVDFTDTDYVLHLFFAWDAYYHRLPVDGTKWRFECLAFGPKGGATLGGSEAVHNSSKFCDLAFELKKDDVTAIRRALIYRSAKKWRRNGRLDRFDKWNDVAVGDPEFYAEVLKPIEAELDGYAKKVSLEMSDDDVNLVFEKALGRWLGIRDEIDALRKDWLQAKMFKGGAE